MITLEEQKLREHLSVDEITFAIPAQSFAISCAISAEEALPVVTEFALRIAYVCGTVSPGQLQDFFGFSNKEIDAVLHSLLDERLLRWSDEQLELTSYALGVCAAEIDLIQTVDGVNLSHDDELSSIRSASADVAASCLARLAARRPPGLLH